MNKIHVFNTLRLYSEYGQRIAWTILSTGNIGMVDVDRYLDYVLKRPAHTYTRLDTAYVLSAYDNHRVTPFSMEEFKEFEGVKSRLRLEALKYRINFPCPRGVVESTWESMSDPDRIRLLAQRAMGEPV